MAAAEWETAVAAELGRLTDPHLAKKRNTIIALIDAKLAGRNLETVFDLPGCVSRTVYHAKWKSDPLFADVLEKATALAWQWHGGRAMRALAQAAERLALASPVAVAKAIQMLQSMDDQVALRAAFGILDRAGVETAQKSTTEVTGMTQDEWLAQQKKRHVEVTRAIEDFADDDSAEPATDE